MERLGRGTEPPPGRSGAVVRSVGSLGFPAALLRGTLPLFLFLALAGLLPACGDANTPVGRLAFYADRFGNLDVTVADPGGADSIRLTGTVPGDGFPAWSADGSGVAYYAREGATHDVYFDPADGS